MTDFKIINPPPARHLKGSRLQPDEKGLCQEPFSAIQGKHIVIEELSMRTKPPYLLMT